MPRIHARNRSEKLARILFERMGIFKMRTGDIAEALGCVRSTARRYMLEPEAMKFGDVIDFARKTGLTDAEWLELKNC